MGAAEQEVSLYDYEFLETTVRKIIAIDDCIVYFFLFLYSTIIAL